MEPLTRVETYQYPAGHVAHLSEKQASALANFKKLCEKQGYYKPAAEDGRHQASHSDETLLRYLRARKWDRREAFKQFKDTEDWRRDVQLEKVYETIDVQEYEETRRLYPQWTGRRDKRGIPVYVFEVASLDSKAMANHDNSHTHAKTKAKESPRMLRLFALYENLVNFVLPLCSAIPDRPHPETPVSQSNNIVDISKVGLKQFWNLKGHMQDASQLATAHYPETLDRIFIIGAPSFFPTVWGWIKRWFDPITVSKIFVLNDRTMKSTLEAYIDRDNIPKKYGGNLDFAWGDMPVLEPNIERLLRWKHPSMQKGKSTIPTGPIRWQDSSNNDMIMLAVGTTNGKPRNQEVATLQHDGAEQHQPAASGDRQRLSRPAPIFRTTTGVHTHPQDVHVDENVPDESLEQIPMDSQGRINSPVPQGSYDQESGASAPQPSAAQARTEEVRSGTSTTRYAQQDYTHASGQLSEGTPELVDHGHGDKTATIETATVGQAPKEHPLPSDDAPADNSYMAQAKALAENAYETGMNAVGAAMGAMGLQHGNDEGAAEQRDKEDESTTKVRDPRVAESDDVAVEEFLRNQYSSTQRVGQRKVDQANK